MSNENLLNHKKNHFGTFEAALATLLFVVFNFVFMEGFYSFAYNYGVTSLGVLLAQFLVEALFGVAAWVVAIVCKKNIIKAAGMDKKVSVTMVIYGALIAFCCIFFFSGLTSAFMELLALLGYNSSGGSINMNSFGAYIGYVIAACVTPAVCEEILFRGTIQAGLKKYGKWVSIISASFIFMLMHGGPDQTIHQFLIGVIVGYMFFETGNVWLGVIVHFFNNFISITELYFYNLLIPSTETTEEVVETISTSEAWSQFAITLSVSIIMAIIGYFLVRFLMKKIIEEDKKVNSNVACDVAQSQVETLVVDGETVETVLTVSNTQENDSEEDFDTNKVANESDKKSMTAGEILLFAIPIVWMIFQWFFSLLQGL